MLLITEKTPETIIDRAQKYFGQILLLPEHSFLDKKTAFHTDLVCCRFEDALVCAPSLFAVLKKKNPTLPLIKGEKEPSGCYPGEVLYNAVAVGSFLFCNEKLTDSVILQHAKDSGIKIISVKQGYTKCSVIPVEKNALITADTKIADSAQEKGLEVLLTTNDPVVLPGFPNGFIGGCAVCGDGFVFFTGDLRRHPDAENIQEFCRKHKKEPLWVPGLPLLDLGSPVWVQE